MIEHVSRLRAIGRLTDDQLRRATFYRNGKVRDVHPVVKGILDKIIVEGVSLEKLESEMGWCHRSAKIVLSVLLDTLTPEVPLKVTREAIEIDALKGQLDMLTANATDEVTRAMGAYGLTQSEARIYIMLKRANGRPINQEAIVARLNSHRPDQDWPAAKIIDVMVCKMRKKLAPHGVSIITTWGMGYSIAPEKVD